MNSQNLFVKSLYIICFLLSSNVVNAQFRVVDSETLEPLIGVYVLDEHGRMLEMTEADGLVKTNKGKITITMMAYEPLAVDASLQKDDVKLQPKAFDLSEVVVPPNDYIKYSAVFRDVYRNNNKLVIYREGIVDFYQDCKSKKFTRRVRACRQWTDKSLDRILNFKVFLGPYPSTNLGKINIVERDGVSSVSGDSTYFKALNGDARAILNISDSIHGVFRTVIDNLKSGTQTSHPLIKWNTSICDWTYKNANRSLVNVAYCSTYHDFSYRSPINPQKPIGVTMACELYITGVTAMKKDDAKAEMKNKSQTRDFVLPDYLPQNTFNLEEEIQDMKQTKFDEY